MFSRLFERFFIERKRNSGNEFLRLWDYWVEFSILFGVSEGSSFYRDGFLSGRVFKKCCR